MSLFGRKEKQEIKRLQEEIAQIRTQTAPELLRHIDLQKALRENQEMLNQVRADLQAANAQLATAKQQIIETDEAALMQSFGIYTPHYSYTTSDEYKARLAVIRDEQKAMIKNGQAVAGNTNWQVNGSVSKGQKMVKDMQKLLLRAYNAECDDAIEHVKFNNVEACKKKIFASAEAISKLGNMMGIAIDPRYVNLKLDELYLMHEYQQKKQEEKEAAKELRQQQREEAKAQKELEEAKKKLEKEQNHYYNELSRLRTQLSAAKSDAERDGLNQKIAEAESHIGDIDKQIKDVDYRAANQKAGYVYVISNIGAFGENVYKIGMTRRLDPMERIDELGDASVPFDFDVHAMIFTEDAPKLEAALHNAFANRKVNFVNQRREFFRVSLAEIKKVVRENYDKTVEFTDVPPAEQYRESMKLRK